MYTLYLDNRPLLICLTHSVSSVLCLVEKVLSVGYRHLDSACDYGNEKEVDLYLLDLVFKFLLIRIRFWNRLQ